MPGVWGIFLLMLAFARPVGGEQNSNSQASAPAVANPAGPPPLKETTDWIESHLVGLLHTSRKTAVAFRAAKKTKELKEVDRQASNTQESVSAVSFEGCSLTLGQLTKGDDYTAVTVSTIPLDRLTQASWKVVHHAPVKTENGLDSTEVTVLPASETVITLQAGTNVIASKRKSSGNVPMEQLALPYEGKSSSISINSDDEAMPPRLVNAFNHAIQLCKANAKPEPF